MALVLKGFGKGASLPIWGLGSAGYQASIALVAQPANVSLVLREDFRADVAATGAPAGVAIAAGTGAVAVIAVRGAPATVAIAALETFIAQIAVHSHAAVSVVVTEDFRAAISVTAQPATVAVQAWSGFSSRIAVTAEPATMAALLREAFLAEIAATAAPAGVSVRAWAGFKAALALTAQPATMGAHVHETFAADIAVTAEPATMAMVAWTGTGGGIAVTAEPATMAIVMREAFEAAIAVHSHAAVSLHVHETFSATIAVTAQPATMGAHAHEVHEAVITAVARAARVAVEMLVDSVSPDPYRPAGGRFVDASGPIIRIGEQVWSLSPGPFQITAVQLSGSIPGGHGAGSFDVPVANAYLAPHHSLAEGAWVEASENGHELYEGEIFSIKPSVGSDGGKLSVSLGGLVSVAGKRADVAQTWVHRSAGSWLRRPGTPSSLGSVTADSGAVDLRVAKGATEDYSAAGLSSSIEAVYVLDDGMSDGTISYVDMTGVYDVVIESAAVWSWALYTAPGLGGSFTPAIIGATNAFSTAWADDLVPPTGTKALMLRLSCTSGAHAVAAEKYVSLKVDVYSSGRTTKPRIDEALVDLATRPGLALSASAVPIGGGQDDLRVGGGKSLVTASAGMATIAALHAQPVMWAFWDGRRFTIDPTPSVPENDAHVVVVGGGNPGLESWDVAEYDEDVPDFCLCLFGNLDDATLPEGYPRRMYAPHTPPDDADVRIEVLDFSGLILSDATAAALASNVVGSPSGSSVPEGAVFDAHPATADAGRSPGNNADPTSSYQDAVDPGVAGTLENFSFTPTSGWGGSGSPSDPTCLTGDGVDDYVTFGDLAAGDFGSNAFTVRYWFRLNSAVPRDVQMLGGKLSGAQGWYMGVDSDMHLVGYAGQSAGSYRRRIGGTTFAAGRWYYAAMVRSAAGEITLYTCVPGATPLAETMTAAGAVGAWDVSSVGELTLFKVG